MSTREIAQKSWRSFVDTYGPLRPDLYRYCRHLTRSPWDAEDLVQDTLARAFATLASMFEDVRHPRTWLFRIASNLWIDRVRRVREVLHEVHEEATAPAPSRELREAAGTLLSQLSPQERSAVVLKDAFDLSLEEIAETLGTTPGAIKAALHRGRGKLVASPPQEPAHPPHPVVLDAFCDAFNARDIDRLTALLLDTATIELVGVYTEYGRQRRGLLHHTLFKPLSSGVSAPHLAGVLETPPRAEARIYRDAPVILYWYGHTDGDHVRSIVRLETAGDCITRVREYFVTPEVLAEICAELEVPFRTNGYPGENDAAT